MRSNANQAVPSMHDRSLLLFDLGHTGHHPAYLRHIVQYWHQHQISGCLDLIVSPEFARKHPDLMALAKPTGVSSVRFTIVTEAEYDRYRNAKSTIARSWQEWRIFCDYAKQLKPTQALLMYLDSLQLPLAFGERPPCPVSGIYFRPSFHYHRFSPESQPDRLKQWRQTAIVNQILRRSQFNTLFCLDQFAVPEIQRFAQKPILPIADPVELSACEPIEVQSLRQQLEISLDRHVFLLFGELSGRKGIHQVLQAMSLLSRDSQSQVCLVLAGPVNRSAESIRAEIEQLRQTTQVQIVLCDRYIKGAELQQFFELADTVLAPYQKHVGMSSILVHAAATHKPILASNYGLLGKLVEQYQLGLAIRAEDPNEIAQSIEQRLQISTESLCNVEKMDEFAQLNLAEKFAETLIVQLVDRTFRAQSQEDRSYAQKS
ncbi:glycosyltransferase [Leptolyngbya sp. AN03gr2]|uniref:glycosyltransferase n=1 Tax=unclassified Leptolyngbya TaxID=2650499 RepID=UPI003D319940